MEEAFEKHQGVIEVISGYAGGKIENPDYKTVSSGNSGHIESVKVIYNPYRTDYKELLTVFWRNVDPHDDKGQFCDRGPQYISAIFADTPERRILAQKSKTALSAHPKIQKNIVTQIKDPHPFYPAEKFHQDYYKLKPVRYSFYIGLCGRESRLKEVWQGIDITNMQF